MFDAKVINVMIASPIDVAAERKIIREAVYRWNDLHAADRRIVLLPVAWESHSSPLMGDRPQSIINKQILEDCDLLVAVFWTRLGSPTGEAPSGTAEEIKRHVGAGKPAMLYFSDAPAHPNRDEKQYRALKKFRSECQPQGLVYSYSSIEEFREKFEAQLTHTIGREFKNATLLEDNRLGHPGVSSSPQRLSAEARMILLECAEDRNGILLRTNTNMGLSLQTNDKQLVTERNNPRIEARWSAALDELLETDLLEDRNYAGEVFYITDAGYSVADALRKE